VNANQATKEPKSPNRRGAAAALAAEPLDEIGVLVELHDDDEADEARPLATDDDEDDAPVADACRRAAGPSPARRAAPIPCASTSARWAPSPSHARGRGRDRARIEEGEDSLVREVLGTTHALVHVLGLAEQLAPVPSACATWCATIRTRSEAPEDDEPQRRRFLAQLGRIRRLALQRAEMEQRLGRTARRGPAASSPRSARSSSCAC
jgi:hypothetical protein